MTTTPPPERAHHTSPAPLSPGLIVAASFLLGPIGSGIALAVNDQRLGLKERPPLTFYVFLFLTLISYLIVGRLHFGGTVSLRSREGWLWVRAGLGVVALAVTWLWSGPQRGRFAQHVRAGLRAGNPLPVFAPALLAGVMIDMFVWGLFLRQR